MMILAYTRYDDVTILLASCAEEFVRRTQPVYVYCSQPPTFAVAADVQTVLARNPGPLVFFGHGDPPPSGPLGQDQLTPIVHAQNLGLLRNRFVCAFCCHSLPALEAAGVHYQATVLGFKGELQMVTFPASYADYIREPLLKGLQVLHDGGTAEDARQLMENEFRRLAQQLLPYATLFSKEGFMASALLNNASGIDIRGNRSRGW